MRFFKTIFAMMFVLALLIGLGYYILIGVGISAINDVNEDAKALVGEQIVLKGDTLEIIDYSIIESTYTLEDSREVSFEYAKKKLIKND